MAPTTETPSTNGNGEDKIRMLKEALKCINGTVDFDKLAIVMGVANGEAMRKRFKRFFEKDEEPLQLTGSTLGTPSSGGGAPLAKTPRTPKTKNSAAASRGDDCGSPRAKSTGRKRKAEAVSKGDSKDDAEPKITSEDGTPPAEEENAAVDESPKKKLQSIKAATPKTPKTPKVAATSKTPETLRTPKSVKSTKVVKNENTKGATSLKDNGAEGKQGSLIISPEVQAKTDGFIKRIGKESGETVGEPEKQAVHDGVEKAAASADED